MIGQLRCDIMDVKFSRVFIRYMKTLLNIKFLLFFLYELLRILYSNGKRKKTKRKKEKEKEKQRTRQQETENDKGRN